MLNRSASLAMSTSVLKALPGKLDIKRHSPSILYLFSIAVFRHAYSLVRLCFVWPDLDPNSLQMLLTDDTNR